MKYIAMAILSMSMSFAGVITGEFVGFAWWALMFLALHFLVGFKALEGLRNDYRR